MGKVSAELLLGLTLCLITLASQLEVTGLGGGRYSVTIEPGLVPPHMFLGRDTWLICLFPSFLGHCLAGEMTS